MLKKLIAATYLAINPQGETITPRAHGIDISKYDKVFTPETATGQLDFVIQRASYRTTKDELFDQLNIGVQQVPIRGAYHYLNTGTSWEAQANTFLSVVNGKNFHFYVCDLEQYANEMTTAFAKMAWDWIHYVKQQTGKKVLLYTSPSVYNQIVTPSQNKYGIDWNTVDLWQAQWLYQPDPNKNPSTVSGRAAGWKLWQYTNAGDGYAYGVGRSIVDLDVFNGSIAEMKEYLDIGTDPPLENVDYFRNKKIEVTHGRYDNGSRVFDYHILKVARSDIKRVYTTTGPITQKALTENFLTNNNLHIAANMDEVIPDTLSPKGYGLSGGTWYKDKTTETGIWFKDNQPFAMQWDIPNIGETDVACGSNILVENGNVYPGLPDNDPNPRTILAYNNKFLFLFMVDGRIKSGELGATRLEIANYIAYYGSIYEDVDGKINAHNLDGGGSSRACVLNDDNQPQIINVPSETRYVINHIGFELDEGGNPPMDELWEGTMLRKVVALQKPQLDPILVARVYKKGLTQIGTLVTKSNGINGNNVTYLENDKGKFLPVREKTPDGTLVWKHITLKKVDSPVEPDNEFVVPSDGFYCQGLHDYQTEEWSYKSRVIKLNYKKGALPETIPLTSHPEFTPLNRAWQEFLFECLKRASKNTLTYDELITAWLSLTADGRSHFDDHAVQNGFTDYITGQNLGSAKGPIAIKCLGMGGNPYKLAQPGFYGTRYLIETLDGSKDPPPIDSVWGQQHLIQWATESTPDRLPDGSWICGRFPQLKPFGTPIPLISPTGTCYIDKARVQRMEAGSVYSPYHPSTA